MTAAKTPQQRGRANQAKGKTAERDLCKWLRSNGFPGAERAVRTGFRVADRTSADPGDITGTPGIVWSVKDATVERHLEWRAELDAMLQGIDVDNLGLIVHKRRGHANPGLWWCWIGIVDLTAVLPGAIPFYGPHWFRATVDEVVDLLRGAGYGTPMQAEAS